MRRAGRGDVLDVVAVGHILARLDGVVHRLDVVDEDQDATGQDE